MKFSKYIKDKRYFIIIFLVTYILIILNLLAYKTDKYLIISISLLLIIMILSFLFIDYFRKKKFYQELVNNIKKLDKAYLVLETISKPDFYEGELVSDILFDINKSMIENVKIYEDQLIDFKDYIEMWIHEVKIPLASLVLTINNHKDKYSKKALNSLRRLEDSIDKVLYYVRSEESWKDYFIKEVNLGDIIKNVGLKNMEDLLDNKIDFKVFNVDFNVETDAKWLEFILNQIVNNSIKYKRNIKNSYIKIEAINDKDKVVLKIIDNGIGIPKSDLKQVFDKTFTGQNGRYKIVSTGMGLYIAKSLCQKLGHEITIDSVLNSKTEVSIIFFKNNYYEVLK